MGGKGAMIGAAVGATYNAARGKDPVKGALIGAAVGATGGAAGIPGLASGTAAAGTTAAGTAAGTAGTTSALTGAGASTAANTAFMAPAGVNPATVINASQAAAPSTVMGASQAPGIFAKPAQVSTFEPLTYEQATATGMQRPIGFLESTFNPNIESSSMAPSFMEQVGSGAGQVGQYAQNNPYLTQMAMQSAQQAMQRPEVPMAPAGQVSRGQIQPMDYMGLLNPQQGTVLRPQPISLLG